MMVALPGYRVSSHIVRDSGEIKADWLALQRVSKSSFFLSWGWVCVWLQQLALDLQPIVIKVWSGNELVALGLFVERELSRRIIFHSRAVFLNEYPFDGRNMVIEYNGLLVRQGHEEAAYAEAVRYLFEEHNDVDEIHFGAISDKSPLVSIAKDFNNKFTLLQEDESHSWQVDLDAVGDDIDTYLGGLSKNRRGQIRRSLRIYEEHGPIKVTEAQNYLEGLKKYHTNRWKMKGGRGVFANPQWENFHRSLITERFQNGEIQLLRVGNSEETIGYLYNFLWDSRVYVLQTGFNMTKDKRLMPGYVVHSLAIIHNKEKGMKIYDFLHGDSLYKRILSNSSSSIYWMVVQKRRLKFLLENFAVKCVRNIRIALKK